MVIEIASSNLSSTDPFMNQSVIQEAMDKSDDGIIILPTGEWPLKPSIKGPPVQQGLNWPIVFHAITIKSGTTLMGQKGCKLVLDPTPPPKSTEYAMFRIEQGASTIRFKNIILDGGVEGPGLETNHHGVIAGTATDLSFENVSFCHFRGKGVFLGGHPTNEEKRIKNVSFVNCENRFTLGQFFTAVGVDNLQVIDCSAIDNGNYAAGGGAEAIILHSVRDALIHNMTVKNWGSAVTIASTPGSKNITLSSCTFNDQYVVSNTKNMMEGLSVIECSWDFSTITKKKTINMGFASSKMIFLKNTILCGGEIFYLSFSGNGFVSEMYFDKKQSEKAAVFMGQPSSFDGLSFSNSTIVGSLSIRKGCSRVHHINVNGDVGFRELSGCLIDQVEVNSFGDASLTGCENITLTQWKQKYAGNDRAISMTNCKNITIIFSDITMSGKSKLAVRSDKGQNILFLNGRWESQAGIPTTFGNIQLKNVDLVKS